MHESTKKKYSIFSEKVERTLIKSLALKKALKRFA